MIFQQFIFYFQDVRPSNRKKICFDVSSYEAQAPVLLFECHGQGGNQAWRFDKSHQWLVHGGNPRCLDCNPGTKELFVAQCDTKSPTQRWKVENINLKQLENWDDPTKDLF